MSTHKSLSFYITNYKSELVLSLVWIIACIIINPIGEFPLNDDWAYSQNVYHLSEEGKLILSDWPAMTLIAQVVWGAMLTSIFGFSFTVLRFSTLFFGLFSIFVFYRILVFTTLNKTTSLVGAFLFMFSPLFFYSSFTFMTEVYFIFTLNFSFYYFFKFFATNQTRYLLLGSLFVLISALIRQPGIAVGLAFAAVYLFNKQITTKRIAIALTPVTIGILGLFTYSYWLKVSGRATNYSDFNILIHQLKAAPIRYYTTRLSVIAMYLGLFSLPISIVLLPGVIKNSKWQTKLAMLFLLGFFLYEKVLAKFPVGNVLFNLGLGPKLLKDTYWHENIDPVLSNNFLYFIKILSLISALIVMVFFCSKAFMGIRRTFQTKSSPARLIRATFLVFFIIYIAFVILNPIFFDRYLLPCIPAVFLFILPVTPIFIGRNKIASGLMIVLFALFCITAMHDYLSWNRARWKALDHLTDDMKIERHKIDGGFEFNAWYHTGECNPEIKGRISWWFVSSDDYVISFGNISGFYQIDSIPYFRLLPPGNSNICILQKQETMDQIIFPVRCNCEKTINNKMFLSVNENVEFQGADQQSNIEHLSGTFSIQLDSKKKYGLLSKYANIQAKDSVVVKVWRKGPEKNAGIVISAEPGNHMYHTNFTAIKTNEQGWELIQSKIIIPANCNGKKLGIYLKNAGLDKVWFDDLEINIFPIKEY
ncbi:MAG: ArnT family glycosyltransferase [Prolixibacteraceae bacterium]